MKLVYPITAEPMKREKKLAGVMGSGLSIALLNTICLSSRKK